MRASLAMLIALCLTACEPPAPRADVPVLLFAGNGTSPRDVEAVERVLGDVHVAYATATSRQFNRLSAAQLRAYRLLIVPGGDFIDMSSSLTQQTTRRVQDAVHDGLSYLGICAGAFLAGDGRGSYNGFDLTSGVRFGFYSAENQGIRKAALVVVGIDASPIEHYWEDGPALSGWGSVVGKYPDGTPAVVEGASGNGWVVLAGVHPEAPDSWRRGMTFNTPAAAANAYAGSLVQAALQRTLLPHY